MPFRARRRSYYWILAVCIILFFTGLLKTGLDRTGSIEIRDSTHAELQTIAEGPKASVDDVAPHRVGAIGTVRLWTETGPASGAALDPTSLATKVALLQQRSLPGRSSVFSFHGSLAQRARGERVELALPGGGVAAGTINLVLTEITGAVRVGGSIDGGGGFSLTEQEGRLYGRIVRPDAELAYVISGESAGEVRIGERWLSTVLCFNLPPEPRTPPAAPPESGPVAAPPLLSSRPSATAVLYLDFDGETVTDPDWNGGNTINAAPSNLNSDQIQRVWERVREDYAPFEIDVTTDLFRYQNAPVGRRMRVIITPTNDWAPKDEKGNPVGGVAYLDTFARAGTFDFTTDVPAWVFNATETGVAEAISHELGHTFGLSHDGRSSPVEEYYAGHGSGSASWAPIMGSSYSRVVTQWSKGEYANADNQEDDVAIIAGLLPAPYSGAINNVGYSADEAGNDRHAAAPLGIDSGAINQNGVILSAADLDFFAFSTSAALITINADPASHGPNLNIQLDLYDASGALLTSDNPHHSMGASIVHSVVAGNYFVAVRGAGHVDPSGGYPAYGSIGSYRLSGGFSSVKPVITSPAAASVGVGAPFTYQVTATNNPTLFSATGLPPGVLIDPSTGVISGRMLSTGSYNIGLTAANAYDSGSSSLSLTVVDAPPAAISQTAGRLVVKPGESVQMAVAGFSANGSISYQWFRDGHPIPGATTDSFSVASVSLNSSAVFWLEMTNDVGTGRSAPIFVRAVPEETHVLAWGYNLEGQTNVPQDLGRVAKVVAGDAHVVALLADGKVRSWGRSYTGLPDFLHGLSGIVDVAASAHGTLALKYDGTVAAWDASGLISSIPHGLTSVIAISSGYNHVLALKQDGTVVSWGSNDSSGKTLVPHGLSEVVGIAAGGNHSVALKRDGTLVGWGASTQNELNFPVAATGAVAIAAGGRHSLALKPDGTAVTWGGNDLVPLLIPEGLTGVSSLSAGSAHSVAVKSDGTLVSWGSNSYGESKVVTGLSNVFVADAGGYFTVVLRDSTADTAPGINSPPADVAVAEGGEAIFEVGVSGAVPLFYQWRKEGVPLPGANAHRLVLSDVRSSQAGLYDVIVSNHVGSLVSAQARLTVNLLPAIANSGASRQVLVPGQSVQLTATATGTGLLNYQWIHNGRPVPSSNSSSYHIVDAVYADGGWYALKVTDDHGSRIGPPVFVNVVPAFTRVQAWGNDIFGVSTVPPLLNDGIAVAAGDESSFVLRRNGKVIGWGNSSRASVPSDLEDVVAVRSIGSFTVALRSNGTVRVWGSLTSGGEGNPPPELTDAVAVATSRSYCLALRSNGTVVAWGANHSGQTQVPPGLSDVVEIAAGHSHALALKADGTVVAWGANFSNALEVPVGLTGVRSIFAGDRWSVAVKEDGSIVQWGEVVPANLTGTKSISVGGYHSLILKADGSVLGWGQNSYGQTTIPVDAGAFLALATGSSHSLALRDATGDVAPQVISHPVASSAVEGGSTSFAVTASGPGLLYYQWSKDGTAIPDATGASLNLAKVRPVDAGVYEVMVTNHMGSAISSGAQLSVIPLPSVQPVGPTRRVVTSGGRVDLSVTASGSGSVSYQWIHNGREVPGATTGALSKTNLKSTDAGWFAVRITDENGVRYSSPFFVHVAPASVKIVGWGSNFSGTISIPSTLSRPVAVAAGSDAAFALESDGTIKSWGHYSQRAPGHLNEVAAIASGINYSLGLLGNGTVVSWGSSPAEVGDLRNVVAVSAGGHNAALVLKSDGTVENVKSIYSPFIAPAGLDNVVSVASGWNHMLAAKVDGSVVAWGYNYDGELNVPSDLSGVIQVAAGSWHSLALKSDGSVVAWGDNSYGQSTVPAGLTNVVSIAAGRDFSLALRSDGSVVAWGAQAGSRLKPPSELANVVAISAGSDYALALVDLAAVPDGFDHHGYLERHPEHASRFAGDPYGAWLHYRDFGVYEGELYDDLFRPEEYLALYPELLAALGPDLKKALLHWLAEGRIEGRLGRIPLEFDAQGYFARNPDVAAAMGSNAILGWQHFWNYGIYEGRAYDDEFRAFEYLALNEDLQAAFLNDWRGATLHWLRYGRIEGRLGRVPPIFDVDHYLTLYPDVGAAWGTYQSTVFLHYYFFGVYEARNFDNAFRVDEYIALNPDLQAVFGTDRRGAFMHWVRWGRSEGRPGKVP